MPPLQNCGEVELNRERAFLTLGYAVDNEKALIEAAQRDPRRFGELYEQNFHRVYAFVLGRVKNRNQAEDLTADVFHKALVNLKRFEWRGSPFASWLYRIASNLIVDHSQRMSREGTMPDLDQLQDPAGNSMVDDHAAVYRFVETLPTDQQRVIELRFTQQKSIREIASILDRTENAVKQLQFRAIQNLRARLGEKNG
jgi:RNA polymerase sigma-70 factor (ECF subfamily)